MSDERIRELQRAWETSGATTDGVAYYRALAAARQPLPCPSCGGRESLNDLARRSATAIEDRDGGVAIGHGMRLGDVAVLDQAVPDLVERVALAVDDGGVAIGHGTVLRRAYEFVAGACGSIETCSRCGAVWNPTAPGRALEVLLLEIQRLVRP